VEVKVKKTAVFGILLLISVSVLFRGLYFSYDTYGFLCGIAMLLVLYFFGKIAGREPIRTSNVYLFPGILLIVASLLSFTKAVNPRENLDNVLLYSELLIIFIVLYDYFHDKKKQLMTGMMIPVVMVGFIAAVVGLMALTGRFGIFDVYNYNGRLGSTFQYSNTAAIYFVICSVFTITLLNALESLYIKVLLAGIGSVIMFAFLMTGSRGGYLTALPAFLLLVLLSPKGYRIRSGASLFVMLVPVFIVIRRFNKSTAAHDNLGAAKCITIVFLIASVLLLTLHLISNFVSKGGSVEMPGRSWLLFIVPAAAVIFVMLYGAHRAGFLPEVIAGRVERLFRFGLNEINVQYRLQFNRDALILIRDHWLFGLGGGGWKAMYQTVQDFFYTAAFVHNHYLQVFVDNGILAFLSFITLVAVSFRSALFSFLRTGDSLMKIYTAGLICGLFALAVHSVVDFNLSFVSLLLLIWVMFAASAVSLPEKNAAGAGKRVENIEGSASRNTAGSTTGSVTSTTKYATGSTDASATGNTNESTEGIWTAGSVESSAKNTAASVTGYTSISTAVCLDENTVKNATGNADEIEMESTGGSATSTTKYATGGTDASATGRTAESATKSTPGNSTSVRKWIIPVAYVQGAEIVYDAGKTALAIISAILLSIYALYFAAAHYRQIAFNCAQQKNYKQARINYEEACRLDPANPDYSFELARIYRHFALTAKNEEYRKLWLNNALVAGKRSVEGFKGYPGHMRLLVRIYLDSEMPLDALSLSKELVKFQKYNSVCYELLAASYLSAAGYYEAAGDSDKARELLTECLEISNNPWLRRSGIQSPLDRNSEDIIAQYEHSEVLSAYLGIAERHLAEYGMKNDYN